MLPPLGNWFITASIIFICTYIHCLFSNWIWMRGTKNSCHVYLVPYVNPIYLVACLFEPWLSCFLECAIHIFICCLELAYLNPVYLVVMLQYWNHMCLFCYLSSLLLLLCDILSYFYLVAFIIFLSSSTILGCDCTFSMDSIVQWW